MTLEQKLVILMVCILLLVILITRRVYNRCLVRKLSLEEKRELINEVAGPFGYQYDDVNDVFVTRRDSWQRKFGYEKGYDLAAVRGGMIFQCWPVYFNFRDKTWLLEFWKGQYGISSGCEIGLYHADKILTPDEYETGHFDAAGEEELQRFQICLGVESDVMFCEKQLHWWLGGFRPGTHIRPERLKASYLIQFQNGEMKEQFAQGLKASGYPMNHVRNWYDGMEIHHKDWNALPTGRGYRIRARIAWILTGIGCSLYQFETLPFQKNVDRLTLLYIQAPFLMKQVLKGLHISWTHLERR